MKTKNIQHISGWSVYKNQQQDKTLFGGLKRAQSQTISKNKKKQKKQTSKQKSIIDQMTIQLEIQKLQHKKVKAEQSRQKGKEKPLSPKKSAISILDQKQYKIAKSQQKYKQKQTQYTVNQRKLSPKKTKAKRQHLQLQGYCPILDLSKQINLRRKDLTEYYDILFLLQVISQKLRGQTFDGKYKNHQQKMQCLFPILFGPINNSAIFSPVSQQRILFLNGNKYNPQKYSEFSPKKSLKKI